MAKKLAHSLAPLPAARSLRNPLGVVRRGTAAALACCVLGAGCQSWGPSGSFASLTSARHDKKTAEIAAHDSFPSPQDVGIE